MAAHPPEPSLLQQLKLCVHLGGWHVTWQWLLSHLHSLAPLTSVFDTEAFSGSLSSLHLCSMEFPEERVVTGVTSLLGLSFCAALG